MKARQFAHPFGWLAGAPIFAGFAALPGRWFAHCHIGGPQAFAWNANSSSLVRWSRRQEARA